MKKYLFLTIFLFGFSLVSFASANTLLLNQLIDTDAIFNANNPGQGYVAQSFTLTEPHRIFSADVKSSLWTGVGTSTLLLQNTSGTILGTATITTRTTSSPEILSYIFTDSPHNDYSYQGVYLSSGKYVIHVIDDSQYFYGSLASSTYSGGCAIRWIIQEGNSFQDSDCNNITAHTLWFRIWGSGASSSISLTSPYNNEVKQTPLNPFWQVDYATQSTSTYIYAEITYSQYINFPNNNPPNTYTCGDNVNVPASISTTTYAFPISHLFNLGTWYAQASLIDENPRGAITTLATSSIVSFSVASLAGESAFISTSTMPNISIDCSGGNWVSNSLCQVIIYLFIPSPNSLNNFGTLMTELKPRAPIGYFYAIQTAMADLTSSSSPAISVDINQDFLDTIFTPIKTGLTIILWFMFGFWIFHRIKHFEL